MSARWENRKYFLIYFFSTAPSPPVPTTSFTVTNKVVNKIAEGSVTFQNNGNSNSCKFISFSLNPGKLQTITVPISCLPLTNIKAKLNDGTVCNPYNGSESHPLNVYICPNGSANCYVSMNTPCKEWFKIRGQLKKWKMTSYFVRTIFCLLHTSMDSWIKLQSP